MATVNVNRENPDQFYRYKMPLLMAKVEGKGNGIKTVIVNMVEVGKALGRPPSYPCKYFGCELGAQTQMDHKIGRYIVNGAHESNKLQDMLDGFIKKFVMCQECDNPETVLDVQASKSRITQMCKACGYRNMVDPRHKLTTFIIKNPPNGSDDASGKKDKKARRAEKHKGKGAKKDEDPGKSARQSSPNNVEQDGEDLIVEPPPVPEENGDEDWSVDTSEEAVKARSENLSEHISTLTLTNDVDLTPSQRLDKFFKYVDDVKKSGGVAAITSQITKIKAEAERLEVMDKAAGILAELLYTDKLLTEIKEYRPIMLHFVVDNRRAQKYLLIGFEKLVESYSDQLLPKAAHILKTFYDSDVLEEESILEWADKASKKHVKEAVAKEIHERVAPVVNWLRTAEEESDEEEDDDDEEDVEVVYTEKASKTGIVTETVQKPDDVGDDLDIDAI